MAEKIKLRGVLWNLDLDGNFYNDKESIIKQVIRMNPSSGVSYTDIYINNFIESTPRESGSAVISASSCSNFCGDVIVEIGRVTKDFGKIKYILLNYFSNNWFYNNGKGYRYNDRTESAIELLNNREDIYDLCTRLEDWYYSMQADIDGILKISGISSKSLDGFSISYNQTYRQSLVNLLPIALFTEMRALHIFEVGFLANV